MNKEYYLNDVNNRTKGISKEILKNQIESYYEAKEFRLDSHKYSIGDDVKLPKGTLLHGTYKNMEGLKEIIKDGLVSSWFIDARISKYPSSVGVWNLQKDYLLKDYINFYSGGTIRYCGVNGKNKTAVIPYDEMPNINNISTKYDCHMWIVEQTKEARFMPSLVQEKVQIGIIFNGENKHCKILLKGDILNPNIINDEDVRGFVNPEYYDNFIIDRKNKDDFFTDRESAILFGIPSCLIEGILVGRLYEKNSEVLQEIKSLLPDCYICNLDGKVILT